MYNRFENFYLFNNLLPKSFAISHANKNLCFDSTRRFIDIVRLINRRWPFSIPYISSMHGISFWRLLFEGFPAAAINCSNLYDASVKSATTALQELDGNFLLELIQYEDFNNGSGIFYYSTTVSETEISVKVPYDLPSFYLSLMFYGRASAPPFLYQQLDIEPGCIYRIKKQ